MNKEIIFEECQDSGYRQRTITNASADATIHFAIDFSTPGEILTKNSVKKQNKKYIPIDANSLEATQTRIAKIILMLNSVNAKTLNIAGNGIYTLYEKKRDLTQEKIDSFVFNLLSLVLNHPNLKTKIELIRTGGQSGFDESGGKAGIKLEIKTLIYAPKKWKFINKNGITISNENKFKERFL